MLPDPLHPAVVHFPVVLMFLVPISAAVALWAIRRGTNPLRAWGVPVAFAAALSLSAWAALQTGQGQGESVEKVVSERLIEGHEEAAELFLVLTGVLVAISAVGFAKGMTGRAARIVATIGSLAVIGAGYQVGHSGGELVYTYGAASAYAKPGGATGTGSGDAAERGQKGERAEKGERGEREGGR